MEILYSQCNSALGTFFTLTLPCSCRHCKWPKQQQHFGWTNSCEWNLINIRRWTLFLEYRGKLCRSVKAVSTGHFIIYLRTFQYDLCTLEHACAFQRGKCHWNVLILFSSSLCTSLWSSSSEQILLTMRDLFIISSLFGDWKKIHDESNVH